MSERLNLMVDDGIGDLLTELAGGERRRGAWLSDLVRGLGVETLKVSGADFEALRLSHSALCAQTRHSDSRLLLLETRLQAIESQLAAVMAAGGAHER